MMSLTLITFYTLILVAIAFIDIKTRLVLDKMTYPAMTIIFAISLLRGNWWITIAGGLSAALLMLLFVILLRGNLGIGDVKLAALTGIMAGFPYSIVVVALSWIVGMIIAPFFKKGGQQTMPFAPAISISAIAVLTWQIVR